MTDPRTAAVIAEHRAGRPATRGWTAEQRAEQSAISSARMTDQQKRRMQAGLRQFFSAMTPEQRAAWSAQRQTADSRTRRAAARTLQWDDDMLAALAHVLTGGGTMIVAATRVGVCVQTARHKARELGLPIPTRGSPPTRGHRVAP